MKTGRKTTYCELFEAQKEPLPREELEAEALTNPCNRLTLTTGSDSSIRHVQITRSAQLGRTGNEEEHQEGNVEGRFQSHPTAPPQQEPVPTNVHSTEDSSSVPSTTTDEHNMAEIQ